MVMKFKVMIIEDDFRVANVLEDAVNNVERFQVVKKSMSREDSIHFLKHTDYLPDLILLDVYIPDVTGLDLLWEIRNQYKHIDIMMITAAKEVSTVEESMRSGVFDYILKPIDFTRFKKTLHHYAEQRSFFENHKEMDQDAIDLVMKQTVNQASVTELPKGIDEVTLNIVKDTIDQNSEKGISAMDAANCIGVSRPTARRYLEYLTSIHYAESYSNYGDLGRPQRLYFKKQHLQ